MSQTTAILAILLLSMIFSSIIQSIEGRNIKFESRNDFLKHNVHTLMISKRESRKMREDGGNSQAYKAALDNEHVDASPPPGHVDGHSPGIGHSIQN
ncbi:hypothetical protein RND71_034211 [Anisodus tanguticus]|uniref:Uncharacterized protein n=1 Tax=Anisodus tanguticus TaxID=243964 RepID=A0AAE1UY64_9SOLA|nr:hypothetical protein RND71_034211 [Anisodus tanguticus]